MKNPGMTSWLSPLRSAARKAFRLLPSAFCLAIAWLGLAPATAIAQSYPAKPIRLIVPFPPGGGTDTTARILAAALADGPGWQLVIENRPGATGRIGTELAAKAAPDGYTLLLATAGPNAILPGANVKLPYDPVKDFEAISLIDSAAYALVVHPSLPVRTVRDLIALARKQPGQITFASAGNLSVGHVAAEFLKQFAKIDMVHVPYKGGGPAVIATMSGETAIYFGGPSVVGQVRAGKLRAVATTGAKRSKVFPDLPTVAETLPGYQIAQWVGVLAPAGISHDVVSTVHATIVKAVNTPRIKQRFADVGTELIGSTPAELAAHIRSEIAKWQKVLRGSGMPLR